MDRGRDQALPTRELGQHVLAYAAWPGALGAPRKHPDRPRSEALSACPASQGGNVEAAKAGAYLGPQSGPPTWTSRVGLPREGGRHGWSGPLAPCARVPQAWLTSCVQAATLSSPWPSVIPTPSLKGSHVATLAAGSLYEHLLGSLHGSRPLWTIVDHPGPCAPQSTVPPGHTPALPTASVWLAVSRPALPRRGFQHWGSEFPLTRHKISRSQSPKAHRVTSRPLLCQGPGTVAAWPPTGQPLPKVLTYHPPPEGIGVAAKLDAARLVHGVLLGQVHEVGGEDEAQEADVQGGDQLLGAEQRAVGRSGRGVVGPQERAAQTRAARLPRRQRTSQ